MTFRTYPGLPRAPQTYDPVVFQQLIDNLQNYLQLSARALAEDYVLSNVTQDKTVDLRTATITGITAANPGVATAAGHGFANDDNVMIFGVLGMVEVNASIFAVKNQATNTFELGTTNTSGFTAYASGGIALASNIAEIGGLLGALIEDLQDVGALG